MTKIGSLILQNVGGKKKGVKMEDIFKIFDWQIEELGFNVPTMKESRVIIRQNGHPLGNWKIYKPTRKKQYFIKRIV